MEQKCFVPKQQVEYFIPLMAFLPL